MKTDNKMEFCSRGLDEFHKNEGIVQHHMVRLEKHENKIEVQKKMIDLFWREINECSQMLICQMSFGPRQSIQVAIWLINPLL